MKKQPEELDFFFASACESTKRLPRRLQLRIKQEVMRLIINAETEFLDQPTPQHPNILLLQHPLSSVLKHLVVAQWLG